jgi:hypothetical protein
MMRRASGTRCGGLQHTKGDDARSVQAAISTLSTWTNPVSTVGATGPNREMLRGTRFRIKHTLSIRRVHIPLCVDLNACWAIPKAIVPPVGAPRQALLYLGESFTAYGLSPRV